MVDEYNQKEVNANACIIMHMHRISLSSQISYTDNTTKTKNIIKRNKIERMLLTSRH